MSKTVFYAVFILLIFSLGCEKKEDVVILPGECVLQSDCNELEDCKFSSLRAEKGECVPMIECSESASCSDGRACRPKDEKSYCGYSSQPFSITTEEILEATKGVYYEKYLSAEGDSGNHFFTLNQGASLPSGLSLESNGKIHGTPQEKINSFSFSVVVVNGKISDIYFYNTRAVEKNFTFNIIEEQNCGECPENSFCDISLETPACVCNENFHFEDELCIPNTKTVSCLDNAPNNATSNIIDVEIYWNTETNTWSEAPNCEWSCKQDFHGDVDENENDICVSNTKVVPCSQEYTPEFAEAEIIDVTIYWSEDDGWSEVEWCSWNCFEGFERAEGMCYCPSNKHIENEICVDNYQIVSCVLGDDIENASYIVEDIEIAWDYLSETWSEAAICEWQCNEWFVKNNDETACIPAVIINETSGVDGNIVEIFNRSEDELDLSKLHLTVWIQGDMQYPIFGTVMEATSQNYLEGLTYFSIPISAEDRMIRATLFILEDEINPDSEQIILDETGTIPYYSNTFESYGRFPDLTGDFITLEVWTPDKKNEVIIDVCGTGISSSQVVLNETVSIDGFMLSDSLGSRSSSMVSSQFCIAIDGTNISDFECFDASFDETQGYNHKYSINYTANEVNLFEFFFRFSGDGGFNWVPCSSSPGTFYKDGESFNEEIIGSFGVIEQ